MSISPVCVLHSAARALWEAEPPNYCQSATGGVHVHAQGEQKSKKKKRGVGGGGERAVEVKGGKFATCLCGEMNTRFINCWALARFSAGPATASTWFDWLVPVREYLFKCDLIGWCLCGSICLNVIWLAAAWVELFLKFYQSQCEAMEPHCSCAWCHPIQSEYAEFPLKPPKIAGKKLKHWTSTLPSCRSVHQHQQMRSHGSVVVCLSMLWTVSSIWF